jgi:hypothetical protein
MADTTERPGLDYELLAARLSAAAKKDYYQMVVEAPFENTLEMALLFVGFICLYIVDEQKQEIQLKGASGTPEYALAVQNYNFNPAKFHLSFDTDQDNTIVQAIASGQPSGTSDWVSLSRKHKSAEAVRFNQANSGIAYTAVYPFRGLQRGALMYNFYQYAEDMTDEQREFMERYTKLVSADIG